MTDHSSNGTVAYDVEGGIAWVRFNRPDKRNCMSPTLNRDMGEVLDKLEFRDDVGVFVLSGEGTAWSAGTWRGSTWAGSGWSGDTWTPVAWSGRTWSGTEWSSRRWSTMTFLSRRWSGDDWSSRRWSADAWSSRRWSTQGTW